MRHCHGLLRAGEGVGMADEALDPEQVLFKIGNNPRKLVGFQTRPHHIELLAADENRGHTDAGVLAHGHHHACLRGDAQRLLKGLG